MGLSFLPEYIVQNALAAGTLSRLNVPACRVAVSYTHLTSCEIKKYPNPFS